MKFVVGKADEIPPGSRKIVRVAGRSIGVFNVAGTPLVGRAALAQWAAGVSGVTHLVLNPLVDVDGDSATVRASLLALRGPSILSTGSYHDHVVRANGGWRFAQRTFTPDQRD